MPREFSVRHIFSFLFLMGYSFVNYSQIKPDTTNSNGKVSLKDCIRYALQQQSALQQAKLDELITDRNINVKLADWFPAVDFNYNVTHYFELPTSLFPNVSNPESGQKIPVKIGANNTSSLSLVANQNIFNNDLFLASRSAKDVRKVAKQNTTQVTIDLIVNVSKAFYDVLLAKEQLKVLEEDIIRLRQNEKDAFSKYQGGLTDKIDQKQATIALNNILANRKQQLEQVKLKNAVLNQAMGYRDNKELQLTYEKPLSANELGIDTTQFMNFENRIEYQVLQSKKRLLHYNVLYQKLSFAPNISLFGNYNLLFFNDALPPLYSVYYPNSFIGLKFSLSIFQGTKRIQNIRLAQLQESRLAWDERALEKQVNTEYVLAMGSYKTYLNEWRLQKDNVDMAKEVYKVISLQYNSGIKTFLDVTVAETDLRTAELNYLNSYYELLSSALDVKKATGVININQ